MFSTNDLTPKIVKVGIEGKEFTLDGGGREFSGHGVTVTFSGAPDDLVMRVRAPGQALTHIIAIRKVAPAANPRILCDHWERTYGDLGWQGYSAFRMLPWYFLFHAEGKTRGIGVATQPGAFCLWRLSPNRLTLVCDVRSGADPLALGDRELEVARLRSAIYDSDPFAAGFDFCRLLCPEPLLPAQTLYGFNDWYYAYGKNSRETALRDAATLAELTAGLTPRPYCVIDAGWQEGIEGRELSNQVNGKFGDMRSLTSAMRDTGCHTGLWLRPLLCGEDLPDNIKLDKDILDPSTPETLAYIRDLVQRITGEWGYELIKHDFSTFDIFGKWGMEMMGRLTGPQTVHFRDRSRTTAEIIRSLYQTIRQAAGDAVIIGCNTVSHICAGLHHAARIGDDTSGQDWNRTWKMGVNTLAFRMMQHNTFYAADADCVGLTPNIPWELNRQWLDLLAYSGTPLFVSADPASLGDAQREAIAAAFKVAAAAPAPAKPLDWFDNAQPCRWQTAAGERVYDWDGDVPVCMGIERGDNAFI